MASASHTHELNSLSSLVKTLTNSQLKDILRNEGLAVSGVKASLQIRIIECSSSLSGVGKTGRRLTVLIQSPNGLAKQGTRRLSIA